MESNRPPVVLETDRLVLRDLTPADAVLGRCGLLPWEIEGRTEVEVAYLLARSHWGRGLATEAARAIAAHAFATLPVDRLICLIDPANAASRNVATKLGMSLLWKDHVDEYGTCDVYALPRGGLLL